MGKKCSDNNWIKDIPNKDLVKIIYELYLNKINIKFIHVNSHTKKTDMHSIGNAHADKLARNSINSNTK